MKTTKILGATPPLMQGSENNAVFKITTVVMKIPSHVNSNLKGGSRVPPDVYNCMCK